MKYCQNCGVPLDDNARFCIECGAPSPEKSTVAQSYAPVQLLSSNRVLDTVRGCAKSPLFLVAIIAFSLTIILSIIASISTGSSMSISAGMYGDMQVDMSGFYLVVAIISAVIGSAPSVLVAVCMWMTYGSAAGKKERMSTAGLSILRIMMLIMLIMMCVCAGMFLIVFLIFAIIFIMVPDLSYFDFSSNIPGLDPQMPEAVFAIMLVVAFVMVALFCTLGIIYYVKILKTVTSIRDTIKTGKIVGKVSSFVAVMAIVVGAFFIFGGLASMLVNPVITGVATIASALSSILFGALLFSYKKAIKALEI